MLLQYGKIISSFFHVITYILYCLGCRTYEDNKFFFFFLADVYHMWSLAWRISMSQEYPTPIPFETFLCGSMKWCIFNKCHDGLAEVLVYRQSNWNYLLWSSLVFTYSLYHPPLSGIRSWFSFGKSPLPRPCGPSEITTVPHLLWTNNRLF